MAGRALRVTVLGHTAELGGAELSLVRLCGALNDHDVAIRVVLFSDGPLVGRLRAIGVPVEVVPLARDITTVDRVSSSRFGPRNLWRTVRVLPFLVRLTAQLVKSQPDVVHATTLKANLLSAVPAKLARKPLTWQFHDRITDEYLPGKLVRLLRAAARAVPRAIIVNSHQTGETLGPAAARAVVVYPGFSADQRVRWSAVRPDPKVPIVGLVGRISPTKGQLELVQAAAQVLKEFPEARFRVAGSAMFGADEYERRVKAEAARLKVADAFTWVGFVEDINEEIDRLSVLVHASPVAEPFGQVIVEAMIRGIPVVATRAGGAVEIVQPVDCAADTLGLLVAPGNVEDLAAAIQRILRDPAAARDRASHAHRSASARFAMTESARRVAEVWRAVATSMTTAPSSTPDTGVLGTAHPGPEY